MYLSIYASIHPTNTHAYHAVVEHLRAGTQETLKGVLVDDKDLRGYTQNRAAQTWQPLLCPFLNVCPTFLFAQSTGWAGQENLAVLACRDCGCARGSGQQGKLAEKVSWTIRADLLFSQHHKH